jgi:hypothetical protein
MSRAKDVAKPIDSFYTESMKRHIDGIEPAMKTITSVRMSEPAVQGIGVIPRWRFRLTAVIVIMGILLPAHAQAQPDERRQYVPFPIDPNFEKMLRDRLQMEKDLGPLKDLAKLIAADPSKFPLDEMQLKDLKLNDPNFRKALKDWAASDPQLREALRDWIKQNPADKQPANVQKFQQDLKSFLDQDKPKVDPPVWKKVPGPTLKVKPATPKTDLLAKTTERVMKHAENSKLGGLLRDSPAWKRGFADLRTSMNNPDLSRLKLGDWQDKLRLPAGKLWRLGEGTLEGIQKLPRPNLLPFTPSLPAIRNIPMPNITAPGMPALSGPSLPSFSAWAIWILLLLLFLLAGWQMLRWGRRSAARVEEYAQVGPWPVRPEAVSTRAELVLAFDYLALLTLGVGVQSWNHHAVARRWREKSPECGQTGDALALLYEQARYTEGVEALTQSQRDQARASLLQLAEAL